jgi:hypothetical protein
MASAFPDDEVALAPSLSSPSVFIFSSFGEYAQFVLGFRSHSIHHVFWEEKSLVAMVASPNLQNAMTFCFIDPTPFMPPGAERQMIEACPLMRHVVVGHVVECNNDLAIATLHPMPQGPINFMDIHNILEDFLHKHVNVGFRSMQPCRHGQAFVRFNYLLERDLLIQNSPHQYGNGTISFVAHNRA